MFILSFVIQENVQRVTSNPATGIHVLQGNFSEKSTILPHYLFIILLFVLFVIWKIDIKIFLLVE